MIPAFASRLAPCPPASSGASHAPRRVRRFGAAALLLGLVALAGCDTVIEGPLQPTPDGPPDTRTPSDVLARVVWTWERRDTSALDLILPANYTFSFFVADTDSVGNPFTREDGWFRSEEIAISGRLFVYGSGSRPPAEGISIVLDAQPLDVPDPRPGKAPRWHRMIDIGSVAGIRLPSGYLRVEDRSRFYVVRGDSAQIPLALQARGVKPDSTWWWLERWEDLGVPAGSGGVFLDYGAVKDLYRAP